MKKNTILQKCWVWNESVTNFVKERIEGKSLNVCAGKNPICDIKISPAIKICFMLVMSFL